MEYSLYTYPSGEEPEEAKELVLAAIFEEEDWEKLSLPRDALEYDSLYLGNNELENIRAKWRDPIYLKSFYDENITFFQTQYWRGISRTRFISDVAASRPQIFADFNNSCLSFNLYDHFEPLTKADARIRKSNERKKKKHQLVKLKSKYGFILNRVAFRLYAIEIDFDCFFITGGAIKIVEEMDQAPNTSLELRKLEYVFNLLNAEGISSKKDLF